MSVLKWLGSLFSSPARVIKDVLNLCYKAVRTVYSIITNPLYYVKKAWEGMIDGAQVVARLLIGGFRDVYKFARWMVVTVIPTVYKWARTELGKLANVIDAGLKAAAHALDVVWGKAQNLVSDLWNTVVKNVLNPLTAAFTNAWNWITQKGDVLWHYVSHPETLAKLLLAPLWSLALTVLHDSASWFAKWLLAGIFSALLAGANLAEDIFSDLV